MPDVPAGTQSKGWVGVWLVVIVELLSLVPWGMLSAIGFMAFDAPGSEKLLWPWATAIYIWSYPVWLLVCLPVAFSKKKNNAYSSAIRWFMAPLLYWGIIFSVVAFV